MDKISIISILFVSFPEAVLVAILGVLAIGKFSFIMNKKNFSKLLLYSIIASVAAYYIRRNVGNEIESSIIYFILLSLLFIFIIKFKFYECILAVLFGLILIFITELVLSVPLLSAISIDINTVRENDYLRILITLPIRIIQIGVAFLLYKYKLRILDLESTTINKKEYYLQIIVYILSISTLIFLALIMTNVLLVNNNSTANATTTLLLRVNIYLSLFVTIILTLAIRNTHEFYKNKNALNNNEILQNLEYISHLIDEMNYSEVKEAMRSLKKHMTKQ